MTRHYVFIQGPYDATYVGPFFNRLGAERFANWVEKLALTLEAYTMPESQFRAETLVFGEAKK